MKIALVLLLASHAIAADLPAKAHIMLTVSEPGRRGVIQETEFSRDSTPGPDKHLRLWIESEQPAQVLVAAFNKAGQMAYPDLPQLFPVKDNRNNSMPSGGAQWSFDGQEQLAAFEIVFLVEGSQELKDVSALIQPMREPGLERGVRDRQAAQLRHWIDSRVQDKSRASDYTVKLHSAMIGGMMRGEGCTWCDSAQQVSVPARGVAVVRIGL